MNDELPETSGGFEEQAARHAAMRQDILRANTAMALVVLGALALALVAVYAGLSATRNLRRAEAAEAEGQERLRNAYIAEARAVQASDEAGGRVAALTAISNAVAIRVAPDLRTEAAACLALSDLVEEGPLVTPARKLTQFVTDPQLRYFGIGETNGSVSLYSLRDASFVRAVQAPELGPGARTEVIEISFSPDDRWLAARFVHGAVVVWDLETGKPVMSNGASGNHSGLSLAETASLTGLSFSPDSRFFIFDDVEDLGRISTYEVATGQKVMGGLPGLGKTYRARPGTNQLAMADENRLDLLEYPGGQQVASLQHEDRVNLMEWSQDGRLLAISAEDGAIYLWEPDRGIHWHLGGHSERCVRLGFNADGSKLFSASRDGTTYLWDTVRAQMIASGQGMGHVFTPDGQHIGFWRPWTGFGTWRIVEQSPYSLYPCDKARGALFSLDLSTSGRWCLATQDKGFRIWDLIAGKDAFIPMSDVLCVRVSPNEKVLFLCRQRGLEVWPLPANGNALAALPPALPQTVPLPDGLGARAVSLSADGHWAAVELMDRRLFRISLSQSAPPVEIKGRWRTANFKSPASPTGSGRFGISPDGRWIATGFGFSEGDSPKIWDGATGELLQTLAADTSLVQFSADGQWLGLAGMDRRSIWSVGDWKRRWQMPRDEPAVTHGPIAFIGNGTVLATARTRQTIELRDWQSGEKILDLVPPQPQSVNAVRVSLDGSTLVTATASDMVEVWRLNELRASLATLGLDWGGASPAAPADPSPGPGVTAWQMTLLASLAGFGFIAGLTLATLRRHRAAVERFAIAEAKAAQRNRELDHAKIELLHSQKMQALGTLAAGIAHDFNNLLSVVRMSNKLIGRQSGGDPEIKEHVEEIEQAVLQGKSVVGSMLGYSRHETPSNEPSDVDAVVENAVSLLSREFLSGIALTLELQRGAPPVSLGKAALEQALLNLLVNASEAMEGQGRLKIAVQAMRQPPVRTYVMRPRAADQYVELSVTDSGPGIPAEIRGRLFEPFFTTKRSGSKPGTGLGLSLVYAVAQQGGLGLSILSEEGAGATFILTIPAAPAPCAPDAQRQDGKIALNSTQ